MDGPALLAWAEQTYPQYFSGPAQDGTYDIYSYRYYPAMGNYIGIAGAKV